MAPWHDCAEFRTLTPGQKDDKIRSLSFFLVVFFYFIFKGSEMDLTSPARMGATLRDEDGEPVKERRRWRRWGAFRALIQPTFFVFFITSLILGILQIHIDEAFLPLVSVHSPQH